MSDASEDAMVEEFDTMAAWTADAVLELGHDHALPAACRGSGSPAALEWLMRRLALGSGTRLVDSGAGLGGPAELAARRHGVVPTLAEPMEAACRAAQQLFRRPTVMADGAALPFADSSFDVAWSLGVLCTVEDKEAHLSELVRVVEPGGHVGLLVFVREVEDLPAEPDGNQFPTSDELHDVMDRVGLHVVDSGRLVDFPASPCDWQVKETAVTDLIRTRHCRDRAWQQSERQQHVIGELIEDRAVVGHLLACTR